MLEADLSRDPAAVCGVQDHESINEVQYDSRIWVAKNQTSEVIQMIMEQETLEVPEGSGVLCVLDETGDSRFQWDQTKPEEVAKAQAKFEELKKSGYIGLTATSRPRSTTGSTAFTSGRIPPMLN